MEIADRWRPSFAEAKDGKQSDQSWRLAAQAAESARLQEEQAEALKAALAAGDMAEADRLRAAMWAPMLEVFQQAGAVAGGWNALAPRAGTVNAVY